MMAWYMYSKRSHARCEKTKVAAISDFDLMLSYIRVRRPAAVVVERT
jgi:hypothetical protein